MKETFPRRRTMFSPSSLSLFRFLVILLLLLSMASSGDSLSKDACTTDAECLNSGKCLVKDKTTPTTNDDGGGAVLVSPSNFNECICVGKFTGPQCQRHHCPLFCKNEGVCEEFFPENSDIGEHYECRCRGAYTGRFCEIPFVQCPDESRCLNGGKCVLSDASGDSPPYRCRCPSYTFGDDCGTISYASLKGIEEETGLPAKAIFAILLGIVLGIITTICLVSSCRRRRGYQLSQDAIRTEMAGQFDSAALADDEMEDQII